MSLCISHNCTKPQNADNILFCEACGSELLLQGRYRVIRQLGEGGFGKTFEVSQNNVLKVLKVLILDDSKAVSLFQQEARVLSQLNHPGIPKAEGYFTFLPRNSQSPLHCLVMEKIEGLDLYQYMEQRQNRSIDEKLAILWLTQLTNILLEVHKQNFFHRDIKPSNIMLKADGNLALIDFGTAREITNTYYQKAAGQNITGIISPGYTPLEQANGKAVLQSDFFALGRTFIYLLTGKSPDQFSEDSQTGKLLWRDSTTQVSKPLAGLIDYLTEPFPGKRPKNAEMILRCISDINNLSSSFSTSRSSVPSTLVKPPQQSTQHKTVSSSQKQSTKTEKDKSSQQIYQAIGTIVSGVLLIIIRLGWKDISKIFQPQFSQPVAISIPTETQENNPEQINSKATSQAPPVSNENTYPQIPYGWKKFEGGGATLWLPESYDGSTSEENLNITLRRLKSLGSQWEQLAQQIERDPSGISIFAIDYNRGNYGFLTNVIVVKEQVPKTIDLESYLHESSKNFPPEIRIVDMKTGFTEGYQIGKIITETSLGVSGKQIYYIIKDGGTIWTVIFSTGADEFEVRLPIFEESIRTLSTQP